VNVATKQDSKIEACTAQLKKATKGKHSLLGAQGLLSGIISSSPRVRRRVRKSPPQKDPPPNSLEAPNSGSGEAKQEGGLGESRGSHSSGFHTRARTDPS
jgi:hypothetical protein